MERARQEIAAMRKALMDEGILDDQFVSIEELAKDIGNPNFVEHTCTLFFGQTPDYVASIEKLLEKDPVDFVEMERLFHKLRGSTTTIGAKKVAKYVYIAREFCRAHNIEMMLPALAKMKTETQILRSRLEDYFQLMRQVGQAEPAQRPEESCSSN